MRRRREKERDPRYWEKRNESKKRLMARLKENDPAEFRRRNRQRTLRQKYGLSTEDWEKMFDAQGRRCAICRKPENGTVFATDHCHSTGKVRGILCHGCNRMLGTLEKKGWLEAATKYLR